MLVTKKKFNVQKGSRVEQLRTLGEKQSGRAAEEFFWGGSARAGESSLSVNMAIVPCRFPRAMNLRFYLTGSRVMDEVNLEVHDDVCSWSWPSCFVVELRSAVNDSELLDRSEQSPAFRRKQPSE